MAVVEIDQKVCCFPWLMPLQPDAYAQSCKRASLSEPPHLSGLLLADGKLQNKIAAVGSTKRLRWSHNDIL